jgi:CBS domain-containing protein
MDEANVAQLPVLEEGNLIGILSRQLVFRYIQLRSQFGH